MGEAQCESEDWADASGATGKTANVVASTEMIRPKKDDIAPLYITRGDQANADLSMLRRHLRYLRLQSFGIRARQRGSFCSR
jgi:hypothetical protein